MAGDAGLLKDWIVPSDDDVLALRRFAASEREACKQAAGIALLGADKALSDRVLKAISARGQA